MDSKDRRPKFDFTAWARLAREDPEAFELERKLLVERAIMKAPASKRQRLRCLQWKLDRIRDLASSPMSACLQMNRLLWEHICNEHGLLSCLNRLQAPDEPGGTNRPTAKVLKFQGSVPGNLLPPDE